MSSTQMFRGDLSESETSSSAPRFTSPERYSAFTAYDSSTDVTDDVQSAAAELENGIECMDEDLLEPIAIVGIGLRFPGQAVSEKGFWDLMIEKKCAVSKFPRDRINIDAFYGTDPNRTNQIVTRHAHFLEDDFRAFDAPFFKVSPVEAASLHPQQRMLLEATYHALENAGISQDSIAGSDTSVYVGCFTPDLSISQWRDLDSIPKYNATGAAASILSNKISWIYDLHGASMTIDTACSSSMVALDLACNALWSGKSKAAIVASANSILSPELNLVLSNMSFLSKDGRCYSFDERADGYARGEGCAALFLKPLSRALKDGDPIRAVIRSSGVNQDGFTSGGITQPSQDMQTTLIRETYRKAGLDMAVTRFFEAHGTGTPVGDPIEARAIGACFRNFRSEEEPLYVGAVKSNIGHLEGASGLAGVIKAVLALENGIIPPNCNLDTLNPSIDAEFLRLNFPVECTLWPGSGIRRASVNSFGFGGANAHVVLDDASRYLRRKEDYTEETESMVCSRTTDHLCSGKPKSLESCSRNDDIRADLPQLLVLSAASEHSLVKLQKAYSQYIERTFEVPDPGRMSCLAHTLNNHRTHFAYRSYAVVGPKPPYKTISQSFSRSVCWRQGSRDLGFVFTGQGAQWHAMGRELLKFPVFQESLCRTSEILVQLSCDWSLLEAMALPKDTSRIDDPEVSQTLTLAIQIAMVDLLQSVRVVPTLVIGHSSGEIAAAYTAGHLSQRSAVKVAYHRGRLAARLRKSSVFEHTMAAVGLSSLQLTCRLSEIEDKLGQEFSASQIVISCFNSPVNVTVSGPVRMITTMVMQLQEVGIFARVLEVGVGYHSVQMQEIASEYENCLDGLEQRSVDRHTSMMSSVSCKVVLAEETCTPSYWVRNMISPVKFSDSMMGIISSRSSSYEPVKKLDGSHRGRAMVRGWIEVGPHSALKGYIRDVLTQLHCESEVFYVSTLVRNRSALNTLLEALGCLHCHGFPVDMKQLGRLNSPSRPRILSDLPPYTFDHSTIYWDESPKNRGLRLREHATHPLLGTPILDWNPRDARWSFVIRGADLPWIQEHRINGVILFPAAGMLVMAIEALRLLNLDRQVVGYEVRRAQFRRPLIVSTTQPVETQACLTESADSTQGTTANYEFRLYVRRSDFEWDEICRCDIRADLANGPEFSSQDNEIAHDFRQIKDLYEAAEASCTRSVKASKLYESLKTQAGMEYGSAFQVLERIRYDNSHTALATLLPFTWCCRDSDAPEAVGAQVVHPTTLDGLFQLGIAAAQNSDHSVFQTMVPTQIGRLWISSAGAGNDLARIDYAIARLQSNSGGKASSTFSVISKEDSRMRIQVDDFEVATVSEVEKQSEDASTPKHISHSMHYNVDLDLLTNAEIHDFCEQSRQPGLKPAKWFKDLELLVLSFSAQVSQELEECHREPAPTQVMYLKEMRRQLNLHLMTVPEEKRSEYHTNLLDRTRLITLTQSVATTKSGKLYSKVGQSLTRILLGELDPLPIIFDDMELVSGFYEESNDASSLLNPATYYLDALAHKNPNLKYIEAGAGTGATTSIFLKVLEQRGTVPRYAEYMFTDIGPSFLERAKSRFGGHDKMLYQVLDLESNPLGQGFKAGHYDVFVAANVLHATSSLQETLLHVRKLLKDGGKLVLVEVTNTDTGRASFAFGLLPGWWLSKDSRFAKGRGPCISGKQWDNVLRRSGFSGVDVIFRDFEDDRHHVLSVMISTAVDSSQVLPLVQMLSPRDAEKVLIPEPPLSKAHSTPFTTPVALGSSQSSSVVFILDKTSPIQQHLVAEVRQQLAIPRETSCEVDLAEVRSYQHLRHANCIVLHELERSILQNLTSASFEAVKTLLTSARSVCWVTNGGGDTPARPDHGVVRGLLRVCQLENPKPNLFSIALESKHAGTRATSHIVSVLRATWPRLSDGSFEPEYLEMDGRLHVSRIVEHVDLNQHVYKQTTRPIQLESYVSEIPLRLSIGASRSLDSLHWVEDEVYVTPLGADEVEVEVHAFTLNADGCQTFLRHSRCDAASDECAGNVTRVGVACHGLTVGDRVVMLSENGTRRFARARRDRVAKIPSSMSFAEAAAVPAPYSSAYHGVIEIARLQAGERILIDTVTDMIGRATAQIAHWVGAEVYVFVSPGEDRTQIALELGMCEDHVLYGTETSLVRDVLRLTSGRGVDVFFSSPKGRNLTACWKSVATFGRIINFTKQSTNVHNSAPAIYPRNNTMFAPVDPQAIIASASPLGGPSLQKVMSLFSNGSIRAARPVHTFPLAEIRHAVELLQTDRTVSEAVIEIGKNELVPAVLLPKPNYTFRNDATYVIAGGLGGLGLVIACWLAQRGARSLLLLSRSGLGRASKAADTVSELRRMGVRVECPRCDIGDQQSLKRVLETCLEDMAAVKGCFQAAMVLRASYPPPFALTREEMRTVLTYRQDATFTEMIFDQWSQCTKPKIQGSWNLHALLPRDMDFFILLSSSCGIFGNGGQANYAAGNTYQDSLAAYRRSCGEKAIAIDLGIVLGEGFVAEHEHIMKHLLRLGALDPTSQEEFFAILDHCCDPTTANSGIAHPSRGGGGSGSQIVVGLDLPANTLARGQPVSRPLSQPLFRYLHQIPATVTTTTTSIQNSASSSDHSLLSAFSTAPDLPSATSLATSALRSHLSHILGISPDDIPPGARINSLGSVDSLVAVELRNWITHGFGVEIAVFDILGGTSVESVGAMIARESPLVVSKGEDKK